MSELSLPHDGFVDLHSHYIPAIDDGVKNHEDGIALCQGLASIGFSMVVATPHIRTAMFPNQVAPLRAAFADFEDSSASSERMPLLGLGAEHFFDDVVYGLFRRKEALTYPGGHAALVELPTNQIPLALEQCFFDMQVGGITPVLAHPERYQPLFRKSEPLERLTQAGALPLLDLMSLSGKYGRRPKKAAERMLDEDLYYAACSDAHRPADVAMVERSIARLRQLVGSDRTTELLATHPRRILQGTAEF